MKRNIIIWLCLLVFSSCDVLNQDPVSVITEKNAWKTESDVAGELNGAYLLTRKALLGYNNNYAYWMYGDLRFGDMINPNYTSYFDKIDLTATHWAITSLTEWTQYYTAIVQCNLLLEKAPTIAASEYKQQPIEQYMAEARFLRGFLYFYITRIWGEVPLQASALNYNPLPREKADVTLDFAIKDAEYATQNLPWKYTEDESRVRAVKATKGAAYALLSHIYMWKKDYTNALTASQQIMDNRTKAGYELYPMTTSHESDEMIKGRTSEGIFEIDLSDEFNEAGTGTVANMMLSMPPYVTSADYWASYVDADTLARLFPVTNPDRRRSFWFNLQNEKPMLVKFKNKSTKKNGAYEDNILVFRLADLYLLRAEALANSQPASTEAQNLLNEVRGRAGATLYTPAEGNLRLAIIEERRKELIGEGHVWYDMLRNGELLKYKGKTFNQSNLEMGAWTWPVTKASMITNPLIRQLPYWI